MTHRCLVPAAALLVLAPAAFAVEPSELKPGLVVNYTQPGKDSPPGAIRLEPTVALTLAAGETPHPRMHATDRAHWKGYVNVVRTGKYTFSARVRGGELGVEVGGKGLVIDAKSAGDQPTDVQAEAVQLDGGVQRFEAVFKPTGGPIQVELFWEGPGFRREPLPHQLLGHLPADRPAGFARDVQLEHGRFKFEELACARCHKPADGDKMAAGLIDRPAPNLTDVAKRSYAGWIDAWLADPARLRRHTVMPKMFGDDAAGRAERYAVVKYLVSLAGKPLAEFRAPGLIDNNYRQSMERGRTLFSVTGCATCHTDPPSKKAVRNDDEEKEPLGPEDYLYSAGTAGPAAKYDLGSLGSKYRPETLATYLQEPLKVNPSGRMPHMTLAGPEALDIARYLCRVTDESFDPDMPAGRGLEPGLIGDAVYRAFGAKPSEAATFRNLPADTQWIDLGRKLLVTKGCVNCHAIEPGGKTLAPAAAFPTLNDVKKADAGHGCLSAKPDSAKTPAYRLDARETAAVGAFLKDGLSGAGTPAPAHAALLTLRRFNCLNCHSKDGEGGISLELGDQMRLLEKSENADDVRPPLLTGVGHKSRTSWLKGVLTQAARVRPWMQLRMPQYGEANVGKLPEAFAFLEGTVPDDTVHKVPLSTQKIAAGRAIIGKGGLGCISCHDIAGVANTGTRGPDLATINQRVRYDWYERWLHQPLRMAPGTKMPQAFVDNKSTLATVLNAEPAAQAQAMWAYLSLGPGLPLPDGMEPPKGLIVAVKDRPEIIRTFMADAGTKTIAVGYPEGVSVAYSADQCRLAYGWAGNFLDATPVWNNRGGKPAALLGPKFWTGPTGHPWGLTANPNLPPDFAGRANHPAFGAPPVANSPILYDGPQAVRFDGFALGKDGRPTFRHTLTENANGAVLAVAETPAPVKTGIASGLRRRFAVEAPPGYQGWFLAGVGVKEPRVVTTAGQPVEVNLKAATVTVPAVGHRLILPAESEKAVVLELTDAAAGTEWRLVPRADGGWQAVVKLAPATGAAKHDASFTLHLWGLAKDDNTLLKGLAAK